MKAHRVTLVSAGIVILAVATVVGALALRGNAPKSAPQTGSRSGQSFGGPAGGPMGPPGGPGMPGDFQKSHKYAFQLMRLIANIGRMEQGRKNTLTPAQAKSILHVLKPLRKKESLEEPAARAAVKAIQSILTDGQRLAISALPPEHKFRQGGPPPGPPPSGAPMGPPPGGGPKPKAGFNPLNQPQGGPPGQAQQGRRPPGGVDDLFRSLEKKAAAK